MALTSRTNPVLVTYRAIADDERAEFARQLGRLVREIEEGTLSMDVHLNVDLLHVFHANRVISRLRP